MAVPESKLFARERGKLLKLELRDDDALRQASLDAGIFARRRGKATIWSARGSTYLGRSSSRLVGTRGTPDDGMGGFK
jgi:hypothetical protein